MDFNEVRLHEVTLKLHTQAWIFSCLSIASVAGKQQFDWGSQIFIVRKMTEQLEQHYCIQVWQKWGNSQVETIQKIQMATLGLAFNKLKWPGHCQSECCSDAGLSCEYLRNCGRGWHQDFFGKFHSDQRFGHEESDCEIYTEAMWFRLFGKKPDSCGLPGSLRSWYGSLQLMAVLQTQEAIERKTISDKRAYYDCNNS